MTAYWKGKKFSKKHRLNISKAHKGVKLGPPSQQHKDNISRAIVGFLRTSEEKKEAFLEKGRRANRKLKYKLCDLYGRRCSNKDCGWRNEDGSFGCDDIRILQLDHKDGNGNQSREGISSMQYYRQAVKKRDKKKYQMLCPNCNWIKRMERKEYPHAGFITGR